MTPNSQLSNKTLIIAALAIVTFICFSYTLNNSFTNWDDDYYVVNNPNIKALNAHNIKTLFLTEGFEKSSNYHPLCLLSLGVNYAFAQLNPSSYYLTNILLHIANAIMVFLFFLGLCRRLKMEENSGLLIGGLGALWFGIHPMHVESVSWIAERKDVLYGLFYMGGLLVYLKYIDESKLLQYLAICLLFILSCLSKGMAVVFPLSLLCVDFLLGRNLLSKKVILEKVPLFAISLSFGLLTFYFQRKSGAVSDFGVLTIAERFMYASYGFVMYVSKFFNPTYLSTFYPYPFRYANLDNPSEPGRLHTIYYLSPILALALICLPSYLAYRAKSRHFRTIVFGTAFMLANLIFVLQFISVGAALMADRYSYVAYIGLIFVVAYFVNELLLTRKQLRNVLIGAVVLFSAGMAFLCYQRTFVWHDARALLTDGVSKYPFHKDPDGHYDTKNSGIAMLSYKWLGNYYFHRGELDSALANYEILITLRSADQTIQEKIARINMMKNGGMGDFTGGEMAGAPGQPGAQGVPPGAMMPQGKLPPGDFKQYLDSSLYYSRTGDSLRAFRAYIMAFRFNPKGVEKAYAESSFNCVQNQKFDDAINQYSILLKLSTGNPYYYFYRGVARFSKSKVNDAVADWETALKVNPKEMQIQQSASYNLCVAYDTLGKDSLAWYYVQKAQSVGYKVNPEYVAKLKRKWEGRKR